RDALLAAGEARPDPDRYVANQAAIIRSGTVAVAAADILNDRFPSITQKDVEDRSQVVGARGSDVLTITFTSDDPELAQAGANALVTAYEEERREQAEDVARSAQERVQASLDDLAAELPLLDARITELRGQTAQRQALEIQLQEALARVVLLQQQLALLDPADSEAAAIRAELADVQNQLRSAQVIAQLERDQAQNDPEIQAALAEQASVIARRTELLLRSDQIEVDTRLLGSGISLSSPASLPPASSSTVVQTVIVGLILGFIAGLGIAYALAGRRRPFTERQQPELVLGAPFLAEVPDFRDERIKEDVPVLERPESISAEAFRFAAASLEILLRREQAKIVAVVSAVQGGGKSTVAVNTALAAAREGNRVLVVDADFGHQRATELLLGTAASAVGLTEVVAEGVTLSDAVYLVPVGEGSELGLLPRGRRPVVAPEFFRTGEVRAFFEALREQFDVVFLDIPPLLQVAYGSTLVGYADAVVAVVGHGYYDTQLRELVGRLNFIGTPVAGYIYNRAPLRTPATTGGSLADVLGTGARR
ncbi:MAG TPA: AAA family ATPase, partial [Acidimicrobiia bacterium]